MEQGKRERDRQIFRNVMVASVYTMREREKRKRYIERRERKREKERDRNTCR